METPLHHHPTGQWSNTCARCKLEAAAPNLLEALIETQGRLDRAAILLQNLAKTDSHHVVVSTLIAARDRARAAIARVEKGKGT